MEKLEIGTKLYRYVPMSGIWEYTVFGILEYEGVTQYAVRSEACTHGWKCELLVVEDCYGHYSYVTMLNHDEEDDQRYWHSDGYKFHLCKEDAHTECYDALEKKTAKEIAEQKEKLQRLEKRAEEIKEALDMARSKKEQ